MTAVWVAVLVLSVQLAAVLGWAMGAAVTRILHLAPDDVVTAGEACRGEHLPSDDDMTRALTEGGTR